MPTPKRPSPKSLTALKSFIDNLREATSKNNDQMATMMAGALMLAGGLGKASDPDVWFKTTVIPDAKALIKTLDRMELSIQRLRQRLQWMTGQRVTPALGSRPEETL